MTGFEWFPLTGFQLVSGKQAATTVYWFPAPSVGGPDETGARAGFQLSVS